MRVIKPGKGYTDEVECTGGGNGGKGCRAILGVDRDDLRYYEGVPGDTWGSRDPEVCFRCPECGEVTDLPHNKWPSDVQNLKRFTKAWKLGQEPTP